jgi:hypothetical protein
MHWIGEHLCPHFPVQPSSGNISRDKIDVKDKRKSLMAVKKAAKEAEPVDGRVKLSQLWSFKSEPLWAWRCWEKDL